MSRWPAVVGLVGMAAAFACPAQARSAGAKPFLRACPFQLPDKDEFDYPQAQLDDENSDDDGPTVGAGFVLPTSGSCFFIDGEIDVDMQQSRGSLQALQRSTGTINVNQGTYSTLLNFASMAPTELGPMVSRVQFEFQQNNQITFPYLSISLPNAIVGLQTSFFDAWTGDEFQFRALAPSQSPFLAAYMVRPNDNLTLTFSLESATFRRVTVSGYGPVAAPDAVVRLRAYQDAWQFVFAGAVHETTLAHDSGLPPQYASSPIWGAAALGYVRYAFDNDAQDDKSYVIAQLGYAYHAPGYLGLNSPTSAFNVSLPGVLSAAYAERATGWNGALVGAWAWSDKWRSAAFASFIKADVPSLAGMGRVSSARGAANLTYSATDGLDLTVEAGLARVTTRNTGVPTGNQASLIIGASHTFPP